MLSMTTALGGDDSEYEVSFNKKKKKKWIIVLGQ